MSSVHRARGASKSRWGSDDGIKLWLNDDLVFANDVARGVAPDQDSATLDLVKGDNRLLIKIVNTGGQSGFYFKRTGESSIPSFALTEILAGNSGHSKEADRKSLQRFFRRHHSAEWRELDAELAQTVSRRQELDRSLPTTLVFRETMKPRPAHILKRGLYDQKGEEVQRGTPAWLPPFDKSFTNDRMGLARWLLMPEHPLTARVAVNRFWQQCFGTGLVETSEDFGNQGSVPSHPELLDWLAMTFRREGWDVKKLIRRLVMTKAYRQDSSAPPADWKADPKNRLLARGPRYRLDAEMLRDQALALSGLLVNQLGGPSVKPPQPEGLWFAVGYTGSNTYMFSPDKGRSKVHRRSLYTFIKRTAPPPQMIDAPTRETCQVRRERTNSPLHALLLMNDPQYVEAARAFAMRMIDEGGTSSGDRVEFGYRLATGRLPSQRVKAVICEALEDHLRAFRKAPDDAEQLVRSGGHAVPSGYAPADLAAWTMVANLILNLDEVLNKS